MQLTLPLGELTRAYEALESVLKKEFPVVLSFKLSRLRSQLKADYTEFSTSRDELIKKYGHKDEQGREAIAPNDDGFKPFLKDLDAMLGQKIEITVSKLRFSEMAAYESVHFTGADMEAIFPFIEDDSAPDTHFEAVPAP